MYRKLFQFPTIWNGMKFRITWFSRVDFHPLEEWRWLHLHLLLVVSRVSYILPGTSEVSRWGKLPWWEIPIGEVPFLWRWEFSLGWWELSRVSSWVRKFSFHVWWWWEFPGWRWEFPLRWEVSLGRSLEVSFPRRGVRWKHVPLWLKLSHGMHLSLWHELPVSRRRLQEFPVARGRTLIEVPCGWVIPGQSHVWAGWWRGGQLAVPRRGGRKFRREGPDDSAAIPRSVGGDGGGRP